MIITIEYNLKELNLNEIINSNKHINYTELTLYTMKQWIEYQEPETENTMNTVKE